MSVDDSKSTTTSPVDRRSGAAVACALLLANISNYGFQVLTGRLLSVEEYGLLSGFMAALTIVTVSTSALQTTAARAVAAGENRPGQSSFIDNLTQTSMVGALIGGVAIALAAPILSRFFNIGALPILFLGLYVMPAVLDSIAAGRLQGSQKFRTLAIYSASQAAVKLGVAYFVLLAGFRVSGLVGGLVVSSSCVAIWGMFASRDVGAIHTHALSPDARRGFVAFTLLWVMLSADIAFARAFFEPRNAGVYAAAAVLGKAVLWLPTVVTQLLFPSFVSRSGKGEAAGQLMGRAILVVLGLSSVTCLGLAILGKLVFGFLYGNRYAGASNIAWQIGLAMIPLAIVNLLLFHFLARGQNRFLVWMGAATIGEICALYLGPKTGGWYATILGLTGVALLLSLIPGNAWRRFPEVLGRASE